MIQLALAVRSCFNPHHHTLLFFILLLIIYNMDGQTLLRLYRLMYLMRLFEDEAARAYTQKKIGGFLHLYNGQEAVATGILEAAHPGDYVITAYRDHCHYLARGGTARQAMAELFGKEAGCSKGRGGSMHFFDAKNRFMGGHGIVGAHVPLAAGLAFASKYRGEPDVTICFLGDGATSIGPFHEGLCLASLWRLPVVYIIENNGYAMGTPLKRQVLVDDLSVRALAYPMARATVEGHDVVECYYAAKQAIDRARDEQLPTLLEFKTYRFRGHSMADPGKYRDKKEVEEAKEYRDPITLLRARIERDFPGLATQIPNIEAEVEAETRDAVEFAEHSPAPELKDVGEYTYV